MRTNAKIHEMEVAIQKADDRESEAEEHIERLKREIELVREQDARQASNISEILEFNRNNNIKMILDMSQDGWSIRVIKGESVISTIMKSDAIGPDLINALVDAGYDDSQTIFCDMVFDGDLPGTASAYKKYKEGIEEVSKKYSYFYISETDLSTGENNK